MANPNALYYKGIDRILKGQTDIDTDTFKCVLVDLDDYALAVSGATNATPIVVTTSATHGLSTGDKVAICGVGGNTNANGVFSITVLSTTTFSVQDVRTGTDIAGSGSYTSGGYVIKVSIDEFLSDIPSGARVATSASLSGVAVSQGVVDWSDFSFSAVTGDASEAIVLYKDTGTASTSALVALYTNGTNLPVTPNGGDINVAWSNGASKAFRINN
ncbi:MAG: hypothetical protein JNJ94_12645 [Chlorobi bacterium]|nr:hypothetical protein [Chlorobiota bacterium]